MASFNLPFFIDGTLNGQRYADFLSQQLPNLLEEVPLETRLQMWYQHGGCPAHNARVARTVLHEMFPEHWIGRGEHISWLARSPDLNPLDFFVGNVKEHCLQ
ncbi:hypothetical protein X777_13772 [Ooceraea biroi]|uniref:Uncharacterized protein n=1 Tax=Ooceraea biroi TaxID=2015173 RepID=A0A026VXM6_OOCBI|nr:hypothetical protein X777_13772 [Ooceraea biroi]